MTSWNRVESSRVESFLSRLGSPHWHLFSLRTIILVVFVALAVLTVAVLDVVVIGFAVVWS